MLQRFKLFMMSLDGGKKSHKTAAMYTNHMEKVFLSACQGNHMEIKKYQEWSQETGIFHSWMEKKTASALTQYMYALIAYMDFLEFKGLSNILTLEKIQDARKLFKRWSSAQRKGRAQQQIRKYAHTQRVVPEVAEGMKQYSFSEQYRYMVMHHS
jgi:hypothetical protein